jgi:hypothetical protein
LDVSCFHLTLHPLAFRACSFINKYRHDYPSFIV